MFKKISALLLAAAVTLPAIVPVQAKTVISDSDEQLEVLKALGITNELPYSVSEGAFAGYLAGLMYDETGMDTADFAAMIGLAENSRSFEEAKRITYATALKYAVIALGYKLEGEREGYTKVAASLDLTDGIALSEDTVLSGAAAGQLLINMLDAEPLRQGFEGGEIIYKAASGETILSLNRDIVKIEGVVTANSITGLTAVNGAGDGKIKIDETVYETTADFDSLLGKTVYGFMKSDSQDDVIIFLHEKEKRNNILELTAGNLEDLNDGYVRYKDAENPSRLKRAKLSNTLRVIYNGVFCGDYTDADLIPTTGNLTLIDNNLDNVYDVAMIVSYKTMVVSGKSSEKEKLVNTYRFDGALNTVTLDIESDDNTVVIYNEDGNKIKFSDIAVGDVVSVAESRAALPKVITVYKSSKTVEGVVSTVDSDEKTVTVGDFEYDYLDELLLDNANRGKTLNIGSKYCFYLDCFGNVVYMKYVNELEYYIFHKVVEDDDGYLVSYMDINEEWKRARLAKRVKIGTDSGLDSDRAYEELSYYQPQVAKLYFNASGELKEVQFAQASTDADESKFTKKTVSKKAYRTTPQCFEGVIWLDTDAMMYVLPENLNDKSKYGVQAAAGAFSSDTEYTVTAYDFDEYGFTKLISQNEADTSKTVKSQLFLVTGVLSTCVDNEILSCVKGVCGDFTVYQLTGEDDQTFSGVKAGDVIQVHTNREGRVDKVSKLVSTEKSEFTKGHNLDTSRNHGTTVYNSGNIDSGYVKKVDAADNRIIIDVGSDSIFRLPNNLTVLIYNRNERTCERGSISDLTAGDMVVCRIGYLQLQEIIVARD